jgi:gliding motility-associated-like protein
MKRLYVSIFCFGIFSALPICAQQGLHGPRTVTAANTVVNEYTAITAFIPGGSTSITVANSALNANGRFSGALQAGDLIMLIQIQGTIIRDVSQLSSSGDTTWGRVAPGDYYSTGLYEFRQVVSVPNATTINIDCGTTNAYVQNGGTARKPMVVRVPRYTTLTINAGGVLTCDDWNGTIGGVLAVEVQGNLTVNLGGAIDATGKGFRGGSLVGDNNTSFGVADVSSTNNSLGAEKGESVAGYQAEYDVFGGRYCRGAPANGGGGGDAHNAGGGGGANAPNGTSATAYWSGNGIPDPNASYTAAWNQEPPANTMSARTAANSAGGGRGGYTFSSSNQNAATLPPGNATWGGDGRNHQACGLGGRPLDYTTGRLFLGGGGGAGDQNNSGGGAGGDGGGLIYLMVFGNISGSGTVTSNGLNGGNGQGGTGVITGMDAGGGGGAGGTIVLNAVGGVANTLTVTTNGGTGGNQVINLPFSSNEAEGPGGGGGGGYIAVSAGAPTRNSNGGNNGTTNSSGVTEFPPNGATRGCPGINNATITNFSIAASSITICSGNTATLTAVITGTLPPGASINWYNAALGGTIVGTGTSWTTPSLTVTTTYWVGACPGWWRIPVTVTVGPAPVVGATALNPTICSGGSTTLTGSGATTYVWNPGNISGTSIVVSPSSTTTYTVTGSTGPGCSATATVTVTVNPTPTVTATASNTTICNGSPTTLTGGGATTYVWNPGNISGSPIIVSPSSTTTYTVTGTTNGCSSTAQITITVNPTPTVTAVAGNATICSGNSTTLTGGGANTYNWNPGNLNGTTVTVSPTATTNYTVTGTGANGCTSTATVTVTVNPTPTVTVVPASTSICNNGSVTLTASGATTYAWNPGSLSGSSVTVSPSSTTTYTVTGTSAGCNGTAQVTVTVNALPTVTASATNTSICTGASTTLNGSGATTYTWNPGALSGSSVTVSPTVTTTYTVTGTDANGCTNTAQLTVTVNPLPTVSATAVNPVICTGGSSTLSAAGASTYNWMPGSLSGSSVIVSPATTTTYSVTGTDANGCTNTATVTVTVNPTPTVTVVPASTSICNNGSVTLTASGATTYAWNPGSLSGSSVTVSPASTTTYTVTGTSAGCSGTAQVTVTVNAPPTVTASATNTSICIGASTTLNGSGATTYTWNPGALSGSSVTVSPTVTTTYTVTGTDANGCTNTAQLTVTVNPTPTVSATAVNPAICPGGSSTLSAAGALTYSWMPGSLSGSSVIVTPAATTTYSVTGTDANGCTNTTQVTVTVNPSPTVTATAANPAICTGSQTTLSAGGATNYTWNPGNLSGSTVSVNPVSTTTYTLTGTDGNGCTDSTTVTVMVNPLPVPTVSASPTAICSGQTVSLTAGGGTAYNWNGGSFTNTSGAAQTDSPLANTTYTVDVTDANGCSDTAQILVVVNPLPVANAGTDQAICSGDAVTLTATGGNNYTWNGGSLVNATGSSQTDSPVTLTDYTVTVTDTNGCSQNDTVEVSVNALPVIDPGADVNICPNSSTQLNASGAVSYLWTPSAGLNNDTIANPVASPTVTTTYIVTGTAANGCSATDSVTVSISNALTIFAGADVTICAGDTVTLSTSGGVTYNWTPALTLANPSSATTDAFPATTTTYSVLVTDANNCQGTDSVTIFVNGPVNLSAAGATTICIGQSAIISATASNGTAPYTYTWSNSLSGAGPHTVSPVTTTTYSVSVTDSVGCNSSQQTITVNVNPPLTLAAIPGAAVCAGTPVTLNASATGGDGNYTYNWLPVSLTGSSITYTPVATGTLTVIVSDGCGTPVDTQTVVVTVNNPPVVTLSADVLTGCSPLCVNFTETSSANCVTSAWDFGDGNTSTNSSPSNCYSQAGTYNITFTCTDQNGCSTSVVSSNMITVIAEPTAAFTSSVPGNLLVITPGNPQQVCFTDNSANATTWSWTFNSSTSTQQSPCFTVPDTGTWCAELIVTNSGGCDDTTELCIVAVSEAVFSVPNVFTPNADGVNDVFLITGTGIKSLHCEIYDRWGVLVYQWDSVSSGWDGRTTSGYQATDGVYYYALSVTDFSEKTIEVKGFVQLIRGH